MKKNKFQIILILILTFIFISLLLYMNIPIIINKHRVNKFINDNNYKLEDYYIYTSTISDNNMTTINKILYDNYFFTKCIINNNENETTKINYYYTKNNEILIEYEHSSTINNEFKMEASNLTYKDNKILKCENILGNLSCDNLIKYAQDYHNEINGILEKYKINIEYLDKIKFKTKK